MDQFDPWQVVPKQVFKPYSRLLISTAFVVVSQVGCLKDNQCVNYQRTLIKLSAHLILNYVIK